MGEAMEGLAPLTVRQIGGIIIQKRWGNFTGKVTVHEIWDTRGGVQTIWLKKK